MNNIVLEEISDSSFCSVCRRYIGSGYICSVCSHDIEEEMD